MNGFKKDRDRYLRDAFRTSIANFKRRSPDVPFELAHFFFFGRVEGADFSDENATHGDIVVGDFPENMNDGKTFQMFNYTSRRKGDFVIKVDDDTTVRWSHLEVVANLRPPVYFGQFHQSNSWGLNGRSPECKCVKPERCGTPENPLPDRCVFFMPGPFYGMSMDVVRNLMACHYARTHQKGAEDVNTAIMLNKCFPDVHTAHLPEGLLFRHGNKLRNNGNSTERTAFNLLVERLTTGRYDHAYEKFLAAGGGPIPEPAD